MESFVFGDPWNPRRTHYAAPSPVPKRNPKARVVSIPIHVVGSDEAAEVAPLRRVAPEAAAVMIQRVFRGFLVRKNLDRVRLIAAEVDEAERRIAAEAAAIRGDARERMRESEMLMGLLLRLDSVREVREYRRKVIRRVIALQEAVDSIAAANSETLEEVEFHDSAKEGTLEEEARVEDAMYEPPKRSDLYVAETLEDGTNHEGEEEEEEEEEEEYEEGDEDDVPNSAPIEAEIAAGSADSSQRSDLRRSCWSQRSPESVSIAMGEGEGRRGDAMERLVAELCERSAEQCRILEGLVERVGRLERAMRRLETKKKNKKKTMKQSGHKRVCC